MKVNFSLPTRYHPYGLQSGVRVTIDFAIPPGGPGYYSLLDAVTGTCWQGPPKYPYPRFGLMSPPFYDAGKFYPLSYLVNRRGEVVARWSGRPGEAWLSDTIERQL